MLTLVSTVSTGQFKRDYRRMTKRGKDMAKLDDVIQKLRKEETLPASYDDHQLHEEARGVRECHIEPDWLLEYKVNKSELILIMMRAGSHSDLRFC